MRDVLSALASAADTLGEASIARDARDLRDRLETGRVYLACIGQFKRGKSTLLNALVGTPALPTGVVPVTSAITTLTYATTATARVHFEHGVAEAIPLPAIAAYVTEQENPENQRGVRVVEVCVPAEILRDGLCLVDTPGIGSVFGANSEVTRAYVPRVDAALVVIGADPPISGDELSLIGDVLNETQTLVFVLGKADRVAAAEREEACAFARAVLQERLGLRAPAIFQISATAVLAGDTESGDWSALVGRIRELAAGRHDVLAGRARRRAAILRAQLLDAVTIRERALLEPFERTAQQIAALRERTDAATQSLQDLSALLSAEQARVAAALDARRAAFVEHARSLHAERLADRLDRALTTADVRASALDEARTVARASVTTWGAALERDAADLYVRAMARFAELATDFLRRTLPDAADHGMDIEARLDARPRFYFTDLLAQVPTGPFSAAEALLPAAVRRRGVIEAASDYLDRLLTTNASRFANDLIERVRVSREALEARVRQALGAAVRRSEDALAAARQAHAVGANDVQREVSRLAALRSHIEGLNISEPSPERTST